MKLMHDLFNNSADEYFIFLSNFSGEGGRHSKFDNSFRTILEYVITKSKFQHCYGLSHLQIRQ